MGRVNASPGEEALRQAQSAVFVVAAAAPDVLDAGGFSMLDILRLLLYDQTCVRSWARNLIVFLFMPWHAQATGALVLEHLIIC